MVVASDLKIRRLFCCNEMKTYKEEISIGSFLKKLLRARWFLGWLSWLWMLLAKNSWLCCCFPKLRPVLWRWAGVRVARGVNIGPDVYFDVGNARLITLEEDVWIAARCLLLCHRRNMKEYFRGEAYNDLPYIRREVVVKKGACVSMGAMVMPGVTIGEGAVVGAYSLVTKDVPAWTVVAGCPAKVVAEITGRD